MNSTEMIQRFEQVKKERKFLQKLYDTNNLLISRQEANLKIDKLQDEEDELVYELEKLGVEVNWN